MIFYVPPTDEALAGIPGLHKLVDDLIVYGEIKRQLMERVYLVMERCRKRGITLSMSKAQVGEEVKFAGFMVGCNGIKANPTKVDPNSTTKGDVVETNALSLYLYYSTRSADVTTALSSVYFLLLN